MTKREKIIKDLIKLLLKSNISVIYAREVAHLLQCRIERVESILFQMAKKELLQHVYELHCCQCGQVISVSETSEFYGTTTECLGCWTQTESIIMNDIVSAYYPQILGHVS